MLRGITRVENFRSLVNWQSDPGVVFARRTVIYGANGTGKTTLSELLRLSRTEAPCALELAVNDGTTRNVRIRPGETAPIKMLVFNRDYVERNLHLFLTGAGTSEPLLVLGEREVEAVEERELVEEDIEAVGARLSGVGEIRASAQRRLDAAEKGAKQGVIDLLGGYDPGTYNSARYRMPQVRAQLKGEPLVALGEEEVQRCGQVLAMSGLTALSVTPHPGLRVAAVAASLNALLERSIQNASIQRLRDDPTLARWVEEGIVLHTAAESCHFCLGALSEDLLTQYAGHFDESFTKLRQDLLALIANLEKKIQLLNEWRLSLPESELVAASLRQSYSAQLPVIDERLAQQRRLLTRAKELAQARLDDPFSSSAGGAEMPAVDGTGADVVLRDLVRQHEGLRANLRELQLEAVRALERHAISRHQVEFSLAERRLEQVARFQSALTSRSSRLRQRLAELDALEADSGVLSSRLSSDLLAYLGHDQLKIAVAPEGAGYHLRRAGAPAENLSEGEKNALALLYFLRSLEVDAVDASETTVIIDDPVSSMDRDALFAAYSVVRERLEPFQQWIILTHDFDFFRMCRMGLENPWQRSLHRRELRDPDELARPGVQFIECSAKLGKSGSGVTRTPVLREMPRKLLSHLTEYHYLFWRVSEALEQGEDDSLPLMPNAARRLLEGFLAFKVPNATDLKGRLDALANQYALEDALVTRVYTFVNRMSHRDEPDPSAGLNFLAVREELRCVLDLMNRADPRHVEGLRKATSSG